MKFSNRVEGMASSPIRRLSGYAQTARDKGLKVIPLNIGQPDIETPQVFYDAISHFEVSVLEYTNSRGMKKTLETMQLYLRNYGLDFAIEELVITAGASEGLVFTMMTLLDEGDEVLTIEPFYPNYDTFAKMAGGRLVGVHSSIDNGFAMPSIADFEDKITDKTKAILLSSPGNPTGRVYTQAEIEQVIAIAIKHDLFIVADEVYREFNYTDRPFVSFGDYPEIAERVVLVDSISKKYSACGARIGSLASKNKEFMAHIMKLCQSRLSVSTLDQVGAGAMDLVDDQYVYDNRKIYKNRREVLNQALQKIKGVKVTEPEGAFYNIIQLPVDDAEKFIIWMLDQVEIDGYTVLATPAQAFYTDPRYGKNEIRLSYCVSEEMIERAMAILALALDRYPNRQEI
ncbi:aspartate aminotransferase [Aerococcus urinaehominis]|uniref:Aminotransferase n=1 Tax=Aerococcus urinaehominis TaxID=128944 RepID=A0A0X8FK13_9LACT|nr:pyridoxal phosphate-dependent aminotransferase [Aerococcus urinaehominis]AMB98735.1 aspartate aminotransferase [Aerococcus urinaehominis]SDM63032.1 aspartate aminotransferase [Aerococcus urinaehominis]